jgi:hypothetical protein
MTDETQGDGAMDTTAQDALANGLLTLFGCIILEGVTLFAGWLGYKGKELLWPHPKARAMAGPAWSLLLVGFQCMIGGRFSRLFLN